MTQKIILGSLILGSLFCPLEAKPECQRVCPQDIPRPDIEFKAGYFFFTSSPMAAMIRSRCASL